MTTGDMNRESTPRILLAALAALACVQIASAQPVISNVMVDSVSHSAARIRWENSPAGSRQVAFDTAAYWDANRMYRYKTSRRDHYSTEQFMNITGLVPETEYVACPLSCDSLNQCVTCGESDPQVRFTTLPEPASHPELPHPPELSDFDLDYPAVDATLNVSSGCSDLQQRLIEAAGATYNNQTVEVVIPAGSRCYTPAGGRFSLYPKSGSGWVIVRSGGTLPPPGIRITPQDESQMATIEATTDAGALLADPTGTPAHHYRFVGIQFTHSPRAAENDVKSTIQQVLVQLTLPVHDIVFDRCWLHGRGYPDRVRLGYFGGNGQYRIAFINSRLDNIDTWKAYQVGVSVTHLGPRVNRYSAGTAYLGNAAVTVNEFSVTLAGSGSGHFRLYVERNGSVHFVHDVASNLTVQCTGCEASYDPTLYVPNQAFKLMPIDDYGNTAITGGQFLTSGGTPTGATWDMQDASDMGAWEGGAGIYLEEVYKFVVRNNYIGATGIGFMLEQYPYNFTGGVASDIEVTRNTFQYNPELFAHREGDSNRVGVPRQHLELKQGFRVKIESNEFLDSWAGVRGVAGAAVYIATRNNAITAYSGMSDITVRNNVMLNNPSCIWISGTEPWYEQTMLTRRVLIENNVCRANAYDNSQFWFAATPWDGAIRGMSLLLTSGGEDYTIRHNTFHDVRGFQPHLLKLTDNWMEGLTVVDNIFSYHKDTWGGGVMTQNDFTDSPGVPPITAGLEGTAALDAAVLRIPDTPAWTFDHNVIVAGCNFSSNCSSSSTDLLDPQAKSAIYPAGNHWPTGSTYGARVSAVGFQDPDNNYFRLSSSSPYRGGGGLAASDNRDIGAQYGDLETAVGYVRNVRVADVGQNAALLQYTAPDGGACTVEYVESAAWGTGPRINDGGGGRQRQVALPLLTPATRYDYRIMCATHQPAGAFWTQAGLGSPTVLPIYVKPPANRQIAEALVEYGPTRSLGTATDPVSCAEGCTVSIPATGGQAVFHRVVFRDASQAIVTTGSPGVSIAH
ncbi:MAG: hypothetical protein ACE141_13365 [Bryobacteraceae bacterium]